MVVPDLILEHNRLFTPIFPWKFADTVLWVINQTITEDYLNKFYIHGIRLVTMNAGNNEWFRQALEWGPHDIKWERRIGSPGDQIVHACLIGSDFPIPPEWYTPSGLWVSPQFEYLAREALIKGFS